MKTYKNIYKEIANPNYIERVIDDALKGKRYRARIERIKTFIISETYYRLVDKDYKLNNTFDMVINEHGKDRLITISPFYPNKLLDRLVILGLKPIIKKSMYQWSVGNVDGRGKDTGLSYLRKHVKKYNYAIKLDIKKFYESIDKRILYDQVSSKISDADFMEMYKAVIGDRGRGLALGLYSSQWLSNYYLQTLDYFIKQELKASSYVRYVDDMVILGNNKRKLHFYIREIRRYLNENLKLELKNNHQLLNLAKGDFIDFIGYQVFKDKVKLKKHTFHRFVKLYRRMEKPSKKRAKTVISLNGWFKPTTNSYQYYQKHLKPIMAFKTIRKGEFEYDKLATKL